MDEQPKLKPCPFCGGEAYYTNVNVRKNVWECRCFDCGATVSASGDYVGKEYLRNGRDNVIDKWNNGNARMGDWDETYMSDDEENYTPDFRLFKCRECGHRQVEKSRYCPSCGSRMRGVT